MQFMRRKSRLATWSGSWSCWKAPKQIPDGAGPADLQAVTIDDKKLTIVESKPPTAVLVSSPNEGISDSLDRRFEAYAVKYNISVQYHPSTGQPMLYDSSGKRTLFPDHR